MDLILDFKNTLILIVTGLNLAYGFLIYLRGRKSATNTTFLLLVSSVGLWGLSMVAFRSADVLGDAVFFAKILYFSAALIPFVFIYFVLAFPKETLSLSFWNKYVFPLPFLVVGVISLFADFLIKEVLLVDGKEHEIVFNRLAHTFYALYIITCFSYAYILLFKKYLESKDKILRLQIIYIIIGTLLSTLVGVVTNLIGPYFGFFELNWFGQVGVIVMISLISYSIFRYQLFNIKLILVEISLIFFNLFLFVNIFTSHSKTYLVVNSAIFAFILLFSVLLMRGIYRDIRDRERIEALAKEVALANERLEAMERQKTEFVSIASHQLRTPLTVIKGYASMILEGTFGALSDDVRDAVNKLYKSSERIVGLVDDLLTVSRLEQGRLALTLTTVNFAAFVYDVLSEEDARVRDAGLTLSFVADKEKELNVVLDEKKIKQIIRHILDNAIKYTKAPGSISVEITENPTMCKVHLAISDTGMGMSEEQLKDLFERFDLRAAVDRKMAVNKKNSGIESVPPRDASDVFGKKIPGIGLYIAREVIHAHKGNFFAESAGVGHGSTFIIELPCSGETEEAGE